MYLTERLIALSSYCMVLFVFCISITKIKYTRTQLFLYTTILAAMGYFYVPDNGSDLSRIAPLLPGYARMSWGEFLLNFQHYSTPMASVYYHFIGKLNNSAHWLPAINAFITFSLCFTVLYKSSKKYLLPSGLLSLLLFFFMSRGLLVMTIANIRTMLALSILGYCIYKEMLEGTSILRHLPLLIVAALFHTTAVAALLIYLTFVICYNLKSSKTFLTWVQNGLALLVLGGSGGFYLQRAIMKGSSYVSKSQLGTGYFYIWEMVLSVVTLLLTLYVVMLFCTQKPWFKRLLTLGEKRFLLFMFCFAGFDLLAFAVEFNIGLRLSWLVTILDMPLFALIFANKTLSRTRFIKIKYAIFLVSFFLLALACARGHLCSLKFFEYL